VLQQVLRLLHAGVTLCVTLDNAVDNNYNVVSRLMFDGWGNTIIRCEGGGRRHSNCMQLTSVHMMESAIDLPANIWPTR